MKKTSRVHNANTLARTSINRSKRAQMEPESPTVPPGSMPEKDIRVLIGQLSVYVDGASKILDKLDMENAPIEQVIGHIRQMRRDINEACDQIEDVSGTITPTTSY
jgi:phenylalanyl-tRNA synthetase beta subunit